jgi:hypothetical protein
LDYVLVLLNCEEKFFSFLDPGAAFTLAGFRGLWNQGLLVIGSGFGFLNYREYAIPSPNRHDL